MMIVKMLPKSFRGRRKGLTAGLAPATTLTRASGMCQLAGTSLKTEASGHTARYCYRNDHRHREYPCIVYIRGAALHNSSEHVGCTILSPQGLSRKSLPLNTSDSFALSSHHSCADVRNRCVWLQLPSATCVSTDVSTRLLQRCWLAKHAKSRSCILLLITWRVCERGDGLHRGLGSPCPRQAAGDPSTGSVGGPRTLWRLKRLLQGKSSCRCKSCTVML